MTTGHNLRKAGVTSNSWNFTNMAPYDYEGQEIFHILNSTSIDNVQENMEGSTALVDIK